jgi:hypothetical protein
MKSLIAITSSLLTALTFAQPPAAPTTPDMAYYPAKVGSKWTYTVEANNEKMSAVLQLAKQETIDGQLLYLLNSTLQGQAVGNEHLSLTEKGLFRHRFNGQEIKPPVCLLKFPVKDGESWTQDAAVGEIQLKITCKASIEDVTVPAGKFEKAVKVTMETAVSGQNISNIYWYAKNAGIVKQEMNLAGTPVKLELEKLDLAK